MNAFTVQMICLMAVDGYKKQDWTHSQHDQIMSLLLMLLSDFTGTGIVNTLKPGTSRTFSEYASQIFLPYIRTQLEHVKRLEVVWDEYRPGSLKAHACSMRGKGNYRHVELRIKYSSPKKLAGFP